MSTAASSETRAFRFFDNREKYLLFTTTCSEKWAVSERVGRELDHLSPKPPAINVFDAGMGDGSVLNRVLRDLHRRFPTVPLLVVGKEISLEDVRLSLDKMADRLYEHPQTVLVFTNMYYSEAPWLTPKSEAAKSNVLWSTIALEGASAHEFDEQIRDLTSVLVDGWQTRTSEQTGNPHYAEPAVLVVYRADQRFILDRLIPRQGDDIDGYDLVIASQPYRARSSSEVKVRNVMSPLARALKPGGRMIVIQSTGLDPGMEIIRRVWPGEDPFQTPRHTVISEMKKQLADMSDLVYEDINEDASQFRFHLHALPSELADNIGTSTLLAAWNAAVYVAQVEDSRLTEVLQTGEYLNATQEVLRKYGELWFVDESFVVSRRAH